MHFERWANHYYSELREMFSLVLRRHKKTVTEDDFEGFCRFLFMNRKTDELI
jgi:hypothetical protein